VTSVALGELIRPVKVARAGGGDYPLLSMTMHDGLVDQSAKFKKRVASADVSDYKVIKRGQMVVGFPIDEGVLDFQTLYDEGIVSPAYGVWELTRGVSTRDT
jgi:type I restriction enzyme S subunit